MSLDSHFEEAYARGIRNQQVMDLARNHCMRMEFVPFGGQGMLEPVVGLPINTRRIRCVKANGTTGGFHLGRIAREFYTEHCVGCELRQPSGQVPTLAAMVEAEERQEAEAARTAAEKEAEREAQREARAQRRTALRVAADPAMAKALQDLDIIDTAGDKADASSALRRLTALAEKASAAFTDPVLSEMLALVACGEPALLGALRIVGRARPGKQRTIVESSLAVLATRASEDAARVLVQFQDITRPADFTQAVVRSLLYVAYGPWDDDGFGFAAVSRSTDPATLKLLADHASETMAGLLEAMLPGPSSQSGLMLPPGSGAVTEDARANFDRATAAAAIGQLLIMNEPTAARFVPALIRNLLAGSDALESHPDAAVQRALGLFILFDVGGAEKAWGDAGESASDEQRAVLFKVWWFLSQLVDPDRGWDGGPPGLAQQERDRLRGRIFEASMLRLSGNWGYDVAGQAADLITDLARESPSWAADQTDALLGGFITAYSAALEPRSKVLVPGDDTPDMVAQIEWTTRQSMLLSAAHRCLEATRIAAQADPDVVLGAALRLLSHERDADRPEGASARLVRLVGEIGRQMGAAPGVLTLVVPVLYTNLMSGSVALVDAAIRAWADVGARNTLPSLFEDLLPVLMEDNRSMVIIALLESIPLVPMTESAIRSGLKFAVTWLAYSEVGGPNSQLVGPAIQCAGRLIRKLPDDNVMVERALLQAASKLPPHEINEVLRAGWSAAARRSVEYARIRLLRVVDPTYNSPYNRRHDSEEVALLRCGPGLLGLDVGALEAAALRPGPERILAGLHIVEVTWWASRKDDAVAICHALAASIPAVPAFDRQRTLVALVAAALDGRNVSDTGEGPTDEHGLPNLVHTLQQQVAARIGIRDLLKETASLASASSMIAAAVSLEKAAEMLTALAQRETPTATYIRLYAELCVVGASMLRLEAADLDGNESLAHAQRRAIGRSARALHSRLDCELNADDPLAAALAAEISKAVNADDVDRLELVHSWASLAAPLVIIEGAPLNDERPAREETQAVDPEPVAVAMVSIDDRQLTGTAVLRPNTVYSLGLTLHVDEWPSWAERLDVQLVGGLSASEIQLPAMTWGRPDDCSGVLEGDGTLVLRFALPTGRPAPPFVLAASWSGFVDGKRRVERLDIAGHAQIRLRPFDASRDAMTSYDIVDERLLALYSSLAAENYPDDEIQAFCRLFTAVCRSGFRFTWNKKYRRGTRITERQFHDDLFSDLLADPELEGRVERGSPLALGFLDIRHDRITAELKVERRTPVTENSAPKYMGQATQYASADGRHLSILAILDMSPKEVTVGTPENYLFTLVPALHGLDNPQAPSLVAVVVVNGNLPVPSSWSRRKPKGSGTPSSN